jgi:preprotein translocase subunit SecF
MMPSTVNDWMTIIIQTGVIIGAVWGFIYNIVLKPIKKEVTANTVNCQSNATRLDDLRGKMQASEFDRAKIHEHLGRHDASIARNTGTMEAIRADMHQNQIELIDRLAGIEANVNVAKSIERLGESITRALRDSGRDTGRGNRG